MALLSNTGIRAGASGTTAAADPYRVKRSTRFNDDNSAYLIRTTSTAGNKKTWTISLWFKRSSGFGGEQGVFNSGVSGHPSTFLKIDTNDRLEYGDYQSGYICQIVTNRRFKDPSAWYHLTIAVDTTQGTEANRFKLYINGVQETSFGSANYYSQNDDTDWNNAEAHTLATKSTDEFDGYLADIHFIDGSAKAGSDFAETNSTTGQWVPKKYDGTYGTNGFHLAMDPANGGTNYSAKGTLDTNAGNAFDGTTSNYAGTTSGTKYLLNNVSISVGSSLKVYHNFNSSNGCKFQVNGSDVTITGGGSGSFAWSTLGISAPITLTSLAIVSTTSNSIAAVEIDGDMLNDHSSIGYDSSGNNNHWHENNLFGNEHTTANENFKVVTYTGTTSAQTIKPGFTPDFVWVKPSSASGSHGLYDTIRGNDKRLVTNDTVSEQTVDLDLVTDGFTVPAGAGSYGNDGTDYVAWCWKAGGAASSNSDGSITSSVSANTTAGFSIVSYEGTGSADTVGHGLGKKPDMIIAKSRDATTNWYVWHSSSASNINTKYALLNTTDKVNQAAGNLFATVGTTTFGVEAGSNTNNQDSMIAYCFTEIEGYSKFGHYIGNDSSTGPIIECGFAPTFVLLRRVDDDNNWQIFDNARDTNKDLKPNTNEVEGSAPMDFLPNGFQVKNTYNSTNADGGEYIYMAIAGPPEGDLDLLADTPGAPYDNELNGGGNYATLNPLDNYNVLSSGNLDVLGNSGAWRGTRGTFGMSSGKWYFEVEPITTSDGNNQCLIGIAAPEGNISSDYVSVGAYGWEMYSVNGNKYNSGNQGSYGSGYTEGDVIGIAFDADGGSLTFYKNGVSQGVAFTGLTSGPYFASTSIYGTMKLSTNFGQRAFAYTPPAGYKALNTYNLTDPTIIKSNTGFDVKTYEGDDDEDRAFTDYNMGPDLVWTKDRGVTYHHILCDSVRGSAKKIASNLDDVENDGTTLNTSYGYVDTFDTNGYTLGGGTAQVNTNNSNLVAYAWDAGSAGSNTQVSAGGLNTVLYDQTQTWSDAITGTLYGGQAATTLFNNTDSGIHAATNNTLTFTTPGGVTLSGTVEVHMSRGTGASSASGDYDVKINGTSVFDHSTMPYNTNGWVNLGSHTLSTLAWGYNTGNDWIQMNRIKVGGKELIDSGVSVDTIPSIASEYRVNTETGFSIVSYTGDGGNPPTTVAHGLNAKPDFIICKNLIDGDDWVVYHSTLGAEKVLELNQYTAAADETNPWYDTEPTSTVFTVGGESRNNGPSDGIIAYCWSGVSGYSKFGSYEGNNDSNGPFVWCGFRPKWILIKGDIAGEDWCIVDSVKEANDGSTIIQFVNENATEYESGVYDLDILSNGFKLRNTNPRFNTGNTYLFAAFADSPFKYANAF